MNTDAVSQLRVSSPVTAQILLPEQSSMSTTSTTSTEITPHSLFTRYQTIKRLGSGKDGSVFECVDDITGKKFALKEFKSTHAYDNEVIAYERLGLFGAKHPGLLTVYEKSDDDAKLLATELCDSENLYYFRVKMRNLSREYAMWQFCELLKGVYRCHSHGVFHLDIKSDNIILRRVGEHYYPCLCDFSLSTTSVCLTEFRGSYAYAAPEVIDVNQTHTRYRCDLADVWSLGVVLYALITGTAPWGKARFDDPHYNHYLHTRRFYFGVQLFGDQLLDLLLGMLDPDPHRRFCLGQVLAHPLILHLIDKQ
jgi:carbon catabolite-derepressing protein kinase